MDNRSESPKPDVSADGPTAQSQEPDSKGTAQSPPTENERLTQEIDRLNQVIVDLKTRVDELEQDKKFLMGQLKGQLQLQNALATTLSDERPPAKPPSKKEKTKTK